MFLFFFVFVQFAIIYRVYCESVALARRTNNRKVVGSRPTKVVCITVMTGNRLRWTVRYGRPPLILPSCRKLQFNLDCQRWWTQIWHG